MVPEHYEEVHHNRFCQFAHDRVTLKNKDNHQVIGMQFADEDYKHENTTSLIFRKLDAYSSDKVAELAQQAIMKYSV